jgi:hypothetical protein
MIECGAGCSLIDMSMLINRKLHSVSIGYGTKLGLPQCQHSHPFNRS